MAHHHPPHLQPSFRQDVRDPQEILFPAIKNVSYEYVPLEVDQSYASSIHPGDKPTVDLLCSRMIRLAENPDATHRPLTRESTTQPNAEEAEGDMIVEDPGDGTRSVVPARRDEKVKFQIKADWERKLYYISFQYARGTLCPTLLDLNLIYALFPTRLNQDLTVLDFDNRLITVAMTIFNTLYKYEVELAVLKGPSIMYTELPAQHDLLNQEGLPVKRTRPILTAKPPHSLATTTMTHDHGSGIEHRPAKRRRPDE